MAGGRPSKFDEKMLTQVTKLCMLGATDEELANFFEVSLSTIDKWKQSKPEFLQAIKEGKLEADANVSKSLYKRALGYDIEGKHIPADTTAIIFWLKNRRRKDWNDKQIHEHDVHGSLAKIIQESFFNDRKG